WNRRVFAMVGLEIEQLFSAIRKVKDQLVTGIAHSQQTRTDAILRAKRIGAAFDSFNDDRGCRSIARAQRFPPAAALEFRRSRRTDDVQQSRRKIKQAEERAGNSRRLYAGHTHEQRNADKLLSQLH